MPVSDPRPGGAILNWGTIAISGTVFMNNGASGNGGALANGDADSGVQASPPQRLGNFSITNSSFARQHGGQARAGRSPATMSPMGRMARSSAAPSPPMWRRRAARSTAASRSTTWSPSLNTIVDGNLPGNCADPDTATDTVISNGHNLDGGASCGFGQSGDISSQRRRSGGAGLRRRPAGGLLSQKPSPGSPALDAGDAAVCASPLVKNEDQRGRSRPKGPVCDIGAIEA